MLSRAEQINEQVGIGYILAATVNIADANGFEEFYFDGPTIMTFVLMPVTVAGRTIYVPVRTEA